MQLPSGQQLWATEDSCDLKWPPDVRRQSCLAPGQCRQTRTSRASCGFKLALRILRATWTDGNGIRRKRAEAHGNCRKLVEVAGNMAESHGSEALQNPVRCHRSLRNPVEPCGNCQNVPASNSTRTQAENCDSANVKRLLSHWTMHLTRGVRTSHPASQ